MEFHPPMQCCACQTELVRQTRTSLTYYDCPRCGGVWFDGGSLEALVEQKIKVPFEKMPGEGGTPTDKATDACPKCGPDKRLVSKTTYATGKVSTLGCLLCFGHWLSRKDARALVSIVCHGPLIGWLRRLSG